MSAMTTTGMQAPTDVRALYTARHRSYTRFIHAVLYPQGLRAFVRASALLQPDMRILDAGCGTGVLTRAVLGALTDRGLRPAGMDAFDLTPTMLERFRQDTPRDAQAGIRLAEANVLELAVLPPDWTGYDLIVSSAMLEYLPKQSLPDALAGLRARLKPSGVMLVFISRRNFLMTQLIERWWSSALYTKQELTDAFSLAGLTPVFRRFPISHCHLDLWGIIVEARPRSS
jgi:SAM-dependent methyltransferase